MLSFYVQLKSNAEFRFFAKENVRFSKLFELRSSFHETEHSTDLSENEIK